MKIRAKVSDAILKKADAFFTGSVSGRVVELVQNCRRAGATEITITEKEVDDNKSEIVVQDNGHGIADWDKILYLGESQWAPEVASEQPAGIGLFSLAPRSVTIQSNGKVATIEGDAWYGRSEIEIRDDPDPVQGTRLRFMDSTWGFKAKPYFRADTWRCPTERILMKEAAFSTLRISVNGDELPRGQFLPPGHDVHVVDDLGVIIMAVSRELFEKSPDFALHRRAWGSFPHAALNFHGHIIDLHPTTGFRVELPSEGVFNRGQNEWRVLVQLTEKESSLRLMLPARTQLMNNEAAERLQRQIQYAVLQQVATEPEHYLPYRWYGLAREMGIEMKESSPVFGHTLDPDRGNMSNPYAVHNSNPDRPVVLSPKLRMVFYNDESREVLWNYDDEDEDNGDFRIYGEDDFNVDIQTISGHAPFHICTVPNNFQEYSWAKAPDAIDFIVIETCGFIDSFGILDKTVRVCEEIYATTETEEGDIDRFEIPMCFQCDTEDTIFITEEALRSEIEGLFFYLGGYYDGEEYGEQDKEFQADYQAVLDELHGPKEDIRRKLYEAVRDAVGAPARIGVTSEGNVIVEKGDEVTTIYSNGEYEIKRKT